MLDSTSLVGCLKGFLSFLMNPKCFNEVLIDKCQPEDIKTSNNGVSIFCIISVHLVILFFK